jgi:hypothetical protein
MSSPDARDEAKAWSAVFRRSRSARFDFAVRRDFEWEVIEALDRLGTRRGGGGPAYGAAASYWWTLPEGSAECEVGGFGRNGVWINGVVPLLLVCDLLGLCVPDFATDSERTRAAAIRATDRERDR